MVIKARHDFMVLQSNSLVSPSHINNSSEALGNSRNPFLLSFSSLQKLHVSSLLLDAIVPLTCIVCDKSIDEGHEVVVKNYWQRTRGEKSKTLRVTRSLC